MLHIVHVLSSTPQKPHPRQLRPPVAVHHRREQNNAEVLSMGQGCWQWYQLGLIMVNLVSGQWKKGFKLEFG